MFLENEINAIDEEVDKVQGSRDAQKNAKCVTRMYLVYRTEGKRHAPKLPGRQKALGL
jgi:hypothetical protein